LIVLVVFFVEVPIFSRLHLNYLNHPVLFALPAAMGLCFLCVRIFAAKTKLMPSFMFSMAFIIMFFLSAFAGLYPDFLPSLFENESGITIVEASSSAYTLKIMSAVSIIMVPMIVAFQVFVYRTFRYQDK